VNKGKAPFIAMAFFFGTQFEISQLKLQHETPFQSRITFSGSYHCSERTSLCRIFYENGIDRVLFRHHFRPDPNQFQQSFSIF
jgi:hypothetical protein